MAKIDNSRDAAIITKEFLNTKITVLTLTGIALGIALIIAGESTEYFWLKLICEHVGAILIAVVTIHFFHDRYIKQQQLAFFQSQIKEYFDMYQPDHFAHLAKSGIIDIHEKLNIYNLINSLEGLENASILILTIWITDIAHLRETLFNLIENKNCKVRILILDPNQKEVISRRAACLESQGITPKTIENGIESNKNILRSIYNRLTPKNKNSFKCRLYNDLVSVCIYGHEEKLLVGNYLMDTLATDSKFLEISGKDRSLYKQYINHFDKIWCNSLEKSDYDIFNPASSDINDAKE